MPILDYAAFGGGITFGKVRQMNLTEQLQALKNRMDDFLITQTDRLSQMQPPSPFPLMTMCCVAVQVLGKVFYHQPDNNRAEFSQAAQQLDPIFTTLLTTEQSAYAAPFPKRTRHVPVNFADLLYIYSRNGLIHSYFAPVIYLDHEITNYDITIEYLVINPNWLWEKVKVSYSRIWNTVLSSHAGNEYINCQNYLSELLN